MKNNYPNEEKYKTAKALISCALFRAGDIVSVEFYCRQSDGVAWYLIKRSEHGEFKYPYCVTYPKQHLTEFTL